MLKQIKIIFKKRDVLKYLVGSELKLLYKNRILGYLWSLLDPLMMMVVYVLIIVGLFKRGGPQFPVLLFSCLLAWQWFTYALSSSVTSISGKSGLILTVDFPKIILPLEKVIVGLVRYLLGLIVLIPMLFIYEAQITLNVLWLPLLILVQFLFTTGCCLICAVIGIYFIDLQNIIRFGIRAWFFLSPALYVAADSVPERFYRIYMLNPFAGLFTSYKNILVLGLPPDEYMLVAVLMAIAIFFVSVFFFAKREPYLAKEI